MTHPDHAAQVRHFGTIAGLHVEAMALDCADHPERPKSPVGVNGTHTWVKVGAAPWVRCDRPHRVRFWSDPSGSPWSLTDLIGILTECEVYEVEDGDWPEVPTVFDDHHYRVTLPAAIKVAVKRYAAQAAGETR